MNKNVKFHSPDGPAFNPGEVWVGSSGLEVTIVNTFRFGPSKWDVDVRYKWLDTNTGQESHWVKDAWNFQVRYNHKADMFAKGMVA